MRIAYFSPLSPVKSGIADYSEELLPYLAQHAEIDLFVDGYVPTNRDITRSFALHDYPLFERIWWQRKYDIALYHMGNDLCHEYIYRTLQQYPGVAVLHDLTIHHFVAAITVGRGYRDDYLAEMDYSHGKGGVDAARRALESGRDLPVWDYPLNRRVIDSSLGVIVHNRFCYDGVRAANPTVPLAKIDHAMQVPAVDSRAKSSLGLDPAAFVVAAFGLVTPEKRIDVALRAFKEFLTATSNSVFLIVGRVPEGSEISSLVRELGLDDSVKIVGRVEKTVLQRYIEAADACINLRFPTCGETSGIALRAMAAGKPLIVSDVGSFAELPGDCCVKVAVDSREHANLVAVLHRLAENREEGREMGARARARITDRHEPAEIARGYISFIQRVLADSTQQRGARSREGSSESAELTSASVDVIEVMRSVREAARVSRLGSALLEGAIKPENVGGVVLDKMLRHYIRQADATCGQIFVEDQMRQSPTLPGLLLTRARRPLHSLVRYYLELYAERQAGFNFLLANALATFQQQLDSPPVSVAPGEEEIGEIRSDLEGLHRRAALLERKVDALRKARE